MFFADPDAIEALARGLDDKAEDVREQSRSFGTRVQQVRWQSVGAAHYRSQCGELSRDLEGNAAELNDAADLLRQHAREVRARIYVCTETSEDGDPGHDGDSGGPAEPTCDLVAPATFCMDQTPCFYKENVVPFAPPQSKPPKKDSDWRVRMCLALGVGAWMGEALWMDDNEPEPPSLQEQAQTAFGQLQVPGATLTVNPTTRTLVSLDTWFWAGGLSADELTGSSAFGLVAIATPDHPELDPGDLSGDVPCDWVTERSDTCSYAYPISSEANGTTTVDGHGAYAASGQAVWEVNFEMNGNPVTIPGAPTELRGPPMNAAVRVNEVQSVVTDVR